MLERFWIDEAKEYSEMKFEINELGTHPRLIELYNKYNNNWRSVLDYGCGDGSLIKKINEDIEISLFDISYEMLNIAKIKLKNLKPRIIYDSSKLVPGYYDCIFLSMVLVCVDSQAEIEKIARNIFHAKKKDGYLFIANPHPCFRDKSFSSYYTEYAISKEFNYFNNGERHKLFIRDKPITFFDFNWTISYIVNTFLSIGFKLIEIREIADNKTNESFNINFPPSIIYVFK